MIFVWRRAVKPCAMPVTIVGAGQYGPLAVAVIGGVISSTLLTLVVIPVAYSLMARWLIVPGEETGIAGDVTSAEISSNFMPFNG